MRSRFFSSRGLLVAVALLGVVASGCKVDATLDVTMREDGSGVVKVLVRADAEAVKAVESGGAPLEQALRLGDLADAGWEVAPWERADDGSAVLVLSKTFGAPEDVERILREVSGDAGPLRGVRAIRESGVLATDYGLRGKIDLENVETGVPADAELVQSLSAQSVDPAVIDQQLLAQLTSSFSLKVVARLPGQDPVTIDAAPTKVTALDATSSVRKTQRVLLLIAAAGFALLAAVVWRVGRRRRPSRRGAAPRGRAAAPATRDRTPAPPPRRPRPPGPAAPRPH